MPPDWLQFAAKSYGVAHLPALHFVDLREMILEVPHAEKERHDAAKAEADRFSGIEMLLDGVAHVERADDPNDAVSKRYNPLDALERAILMPRSSRGYRSGYAEHEGQRP